MTGGLKCNDCFFKKLKMFSQGVSMLFIRPFRMISPFRRYRVSIERLELYFLFFRSVVFKRVEYPQQLAAIARRSDLFLTPLCAIFAKIEGDIDMSPQRDSAQIPAACIILL